MSKLGLPRREFYNGITHYAATWGRPGTLCGTFGREVATPTHHARVRSPVNCGQCVEIVEWIWKHRRPQKRAT